MDMTESTTARTLVLCFDGTSNQFDGDNTNVVKLLQLLRKDEPRKQLVFYQPGIGTFTKPGLVSPLMLWLARMIDMATACYLDEHVLGGYMFLMQNYEPGDKIVMFGFSRGAYTVRALAGMLHKVGLLPRDNLHHAPFAYKMYRRNDIQGFRQSAAFKRAFTSSRNVEIEFMGLWDTVSSVGVLKPRRLPFTSSNSTVRTFRHALALDERRSRFRPTLWSQAHPSADEPTKKRTSTIIKQQLDRVRRQSSPTVPVTAPGSPTAPSLHIIDESDSPARRTQYTHASTATGGRSPPPAAHADLPGTNSPVHASLAPIDGLPGASDTAVSHAADHGVFHEEPPALPAVFEKPAAGTKKPGKLRSLFSRLRFLPKKRPSIEQETWLEGHFDETTADDALRWRAHAGSPASPGRRGRRTDVSEVWFAGCHSDIGGGNDPDDAPHTLGNIALHWMVQEAVRAQAGIRWDHAAFARSGMQLGAFGLFLSPSGAHRPSRLLHRRGESEPQHAFRARPISGGGVGLGLSVDGAASRPATPSLSRPVSRADDHVSFPPPAHRNQHLHHPAAVARAPSASTLQLNVYGRDALSPLKDELRAARLWWALELVPAVYWYHDAASGQWKRTTAPNLGRPRRLPAPGATVRVHESVKQRMVQMGYRPAAWVDDEAVVEWVL